MTRAIRTLLNCQSWCRLSSRKRPAQKKGTNARGTIRPGAAATAEERVVRGGCTGWQKDSIVRKYNVRCYAKAACTTLEHNGAGGGGVEDSVSPRRENTRRQFRRGDCNFSPARLPFSPFLFLFPGFVHSLARTLALSATLFPRYCFFPIHELWLTVERFWSVRAFYGAAAPFITALDVPGYTSR